MKALIWLRFFSLTILLAASSAQASQFASGSYLYFRSNATNWSVNDKTRLKPIRGTPLMALTYEVRDSWIVQQGDTGSLTETPAYNAWGSWFREFDLAGATVTAGYTYGVGYGYYGQGRNFRVYYPKTGFYTLFLDREKDRLWVMPTIAPGEDGIIFY